MFLMDYVFSDRISALQPSAIREILKATADPEMIPFAAGNPDVAAFPVAEVQEISARIFKDAPITALQYGVTEGYEPLRQRVKTYMKEKHGIGRDFDNILITSGATQVMDLATKSLCNFGDVIICENPSFIGSLNCFRSFGCKLKGVPVEADGMDMDALEETLQKTQNARFIYTIPNFQNPSGRTMSLEKRKRLYALAKQYGVLIIEDNPYGELRVSGENVPSIKSLDEDGIVLYAGSFSKVLAPGIRVAYVLGPSAVLAKMTVCKQGQDVHTAVFNQMLVNAWMETTDFEGHIEKIRGIYRRKLNLMCDLIDERLGDFVSYVRPQGGMFVWCELPAHVDMLDFVKRAVVEKVAVVPGTAFMVEEGDVTNCIRMNFTTPSDENIVRGMERLEKVKNDVV